MGFLGWARGNHIYLVVLALLLLLSAVMYIFSQGGMDPEAAKVYLQALTAIATLALLYYAYFNVVSRKEEDIAHLELAVRPILVWELESSNCGAQLVYKVIKHPIYDLRAALTLGGESLRIDERHLDVWEASRASERKADLSRFVAAGLGGRKGGLLELRFSYHSEVGGKYEFLFTKEVLRRPRGFAFQHRKIIFAKYPWRGEAVLFED